MVYFVAGLVAVLAGVVVSGEGFVSEVCGDVFVVSPVPGFCVFLGVDFHVTSFVCYYVRCKEGGG